MADRKERFVIGIASLLIAACGSDSDTGTTTKPPPPTECSTIDDCPSGTAACIDAFCVSGGCNDKDGDGAGIGPGCTSYDCDDNDPAVPGVEVCNGKDDNCNGPVDEGCPCKDSQGNTLPNGATQVCGGAATECQGTQTCVGGTWSNDCVGGKTPKPSEVCGNESDENCNGQMNEGCCPLNESPCPGVAVCSSNGVCD